MKQALTLVRYSLYTRLFSVNIIVYHKFVVQDCQLLLPGRCIVQKITEEAHRQGYTRGEDPTLEFPDIFEDEAYDGQLPEMMTIDGRDDVPQKKPMTRMP